MPLRHTIQRLRETRVLENYSFMTALNLIGALISFFLYPYVIRMTGTEAFGVFPYAMAWIVYFQTIIEFGFDSPAVKAIAENRDNSEAQEHILSCIFTAKLILFIACSLIFAGLMCAVEDMRTHRLIFLIAYAQTLVPLLYPVWYFQGMKNMRMVTYINLACRITAIPLTLLFVRSAADVWIYAAITSGTILIGSLVAIAYIYFHDGLRLRIVPLRDLKQWLSDGFPFLMTQFIGRLKDGLLTILIRHLFGYADVTLYDIAKKVVAIPRMFTQNINEALFPEVVNNASPQRVRRILKYERFIGAASAVTVALLAYPIIRFMFGLDSIDAYPMSVILSWSIYTWLVVGAYLHFVFIPQNRYYYVTYNQLTALLSCLVLTAVGLLIWCNILVMPVALVLSGFMEIAYCRIACHRKKLL
ncbi:MAG: oligosaccharide flippase family protein [Paludibacteraceae bacterium]|nr:oligosaccharide flippase family protein [Paludibacteraceae bacterium]